LADRLNELMRMVAVEQAAALPPKSTLSLPLHSCELAGETLVDTLCALVAIPGGDRPLAVEVPEAAVNDAKRMGAVREKLCECGIGLAYTGFSAGRGRLLELTENPPQFLKLDPSLVRCLHQARPRHKQVKEIVLTCEEQGIRVIAAGVETDEDARECRFLGCHAALGDWFGPPQPPGACAAEDVAAELIFARIS
ncbi:MAG TPA: EAL domain-containing protein, partial [Pirellulales bacterium]|nr:EAL domain-containing protein [Pirellulales bacterium]